MSKASVSCAIDLRLEAGMARQGRSPSSPSRSPSTKKSASRKKNKAGADEELDLRLRQAQQQQALAREMIKTAREMADRAIAMRKGPRGVVLP
jgi:hypothetical protein